MSKKFSKDPLRGFKDFYPEDLREFNWIVENIKDIAEIYSYEEFKSPQLEPIEIFAAKSSDELVNEQSFIIEKKEGERLILIPELTPSLARMIARRSQELKKPIRWYSNPTCFRYERPQRGRRRMFNQINFDILGENSLYAELEIFNIIVDIFNEMGATGDQFQIFYNSRRFIDEMCKNLLKIPQEKIPMVYKVLDKADKIEEGEFEKFVSDTFEEEFIIKGILKLKDAKSVEETLSFFETVPQEFYNTEGYLELVNFQKLLKESGLSDYCTYSSSVVRGLDYYTGIVFEVFDTGKENIRSIFGGGRYDDLLSLYSDEKISGIGFGLGVLMLTLFLKTYDLIPKEVYKKDYTDTIYIASVNEKGSTYAIELARTIRDEDFPCIIDYKFKNLKSQLKKANELGILIVLIIGPEEIERNKVTIRNMVSEEQKSVNSEDIVEEIYTILDEFEE
ncbi:MAG: histidine--tRNA ligase [Candidatus Lokiarchaeota archaeon]|nr:histidine--tRNA ligase [Candidatus Lokiarchaeota archaeon]